MPTTARKLARYLPPALGQIGSAGAQFVLSLQLLHSLSPEKFGVFAFLMIALQLGFGISTAVLCAPYPLVLGRSEGPEEQRSINRAFATGNLLYALMGACVMALCGLRFSLETGEYLLLFAFSGAMFLRWFARAFSYASARPLRAAASDILYGAVVLVGVALIRTLAGVSLSSGFFLMLTARWPGLLPFGTSYLKLQFRELSAGSLRRLGAIWRQFGRWSLAGVLTTESTANAHVYAVTLVVGPSAFAPIAAAQLLIRPTTLVMNALVNFERPQMARSLARGDTRDTLDRAHLFRLALGSIYGLNLLAAIALVLFNSEAVFPPDYARSDLALAAALWFCIAAITTLRTPESILLQAKGNFRDLAFASFVSCAVSVVLVVSLLLMASTVWSLAGILAGQAILAIQIWRLSGAWRKSLRPDTQTD